MLLFEGSTNRRELNKLVKDFETLLTELNEIDGRRSSLAGKLATIDKIESVTDYSIDLNQATQQSTILLKQINHDILEVIASYEEQEITDPQIKKIFLLLSLFQKRINLLLKLREKEAKTLAYVVSFLNHLDTPFLRWRYKRKRRKIFYQILKERVLITQIMLAYLHDEKTIENIKRMIKQEKTKETVAKGVAAISFLTPGIGIILSIMIHELFKYANQYSENYKELEAILREKRWA